MRIGVCTTDFTKRPLTKLIDGIAGMGFDCVQFAFPSVAECGFIETPEIEIPPEIAPELPKKAAKTAKDAGVPIIALNGTFNMAHPDADVRSEGARRFNILMEAACEMDARYITICTGSRSLESLWKRHEDNDTPEAWADMRACLYPLAKRAGELGLCLLIETEASNTCRTAEKARALLNDINSPGLGIVLDPANLFLPGTAISEKAAGVVDNAINLLYKDIRLAHGKDIRPGAGIDFCAAGRGIVDFPRMLAALRAKDFTGDMVLHSIYDETDMPRALKYMRGVVDAVY